MQGLRGVNICELGQRKSYCPYCSCSSICKTHAESYYSGSRAKGNRRSNSCLRSLFRAYLQGRPKSLAGRKKSKALRVVAHIASTYGNFMHDKPLYVVLEGGRCATKRRIDLKKLINDTMLCIEIDEGQRKSHIQTDEEHAYNDPRMGFSGK